MSFKTVNFDKAFKDAECADLDGWEFFAESHGLKIYRQFCSQSKLFEYKVIGIVEIKSEILADVYLDIRYRKQWDSYVKELVHINKADPEVIYWEVAYPWPMSNRDYVYLRKIQKRIENDKNTWIFLARSVEANELSERLTVDEKRGVFRVADYRQTMVISDHGKDASSVYMHYYDDPRGMIPTALVNWAAKTGVSNYLSTLVAACRSYSKTITG